MGNLKSTCRLCQVSMDPGPFTMCKTCLMDSEKVRQFLAKHPHVSMNQVVMETHVPIEKIEKMVKLGWSKKDDVPTN